MDKPKTWVLIRGLARSRYHWVDFPEQLQKKLNILVVCPELAGNGELYLEPSPSSIDKAIIQLRAQIKGSAPFGLIGISLGGMLATRWAQLHPQEISHLVLINSSSTLSPFYQRLLPKNYMGLLRTLFLSSAVARETFALEATSNNTEKWKNLLHNFAVFQKNHPVSLKNFFQQLRLASQVNFYDVPLQKKLILVSKKDGFVAAACSEKIAELWKCRIEYNPEAGHDLPLDDPDWILKKIQFFIEN